MLKPEQIIVEPKVLAENSDLVVFDMDRHTEYIFAFEPDVSVARFCGGRVKSIRVARLHHRFWRPGGVASLDEIRAQVLKVWHGTFSYASPRIDWGEGNEWNIEAAIEYEDGSSRSLVTDGMHVEMESQNGRHWFLRLRPAV